MPNTYVKIGTYTAGASSVSLTSIPQGYKDLIMKVSIRRTDAGAFGDDWFTFNGDGGTNYNWRRNYATGTSVSSQSGQSVGGGYLAFIYIGASPAASSTANSYSNYEIYIPNYSSTTARKSTFAYVASENAATAGANNFSAGTWNSTAAINAITYTTGSLNALSTITLYGIKNS
jgi:hypothetical protein